MLKIRIALSLVVSGLALTSIVNGQQLPLVSQYMMNKVLINPAAAGYQNKMEFRAQHRTQWTGIDGAPATQVLSGHGLIGESPFAVGGILYRDAVGPIAQIGFKANGSYHIKLGYDSRLALGLSIGAFQYQVDGSKIKTEEGNDQAIDNAGIQSKILPDAGAGAFFYSKGFYAGIAALQLIPSDLTFANYNRTSVGKLTNHVMFNTGMNFEVNSLLSVEPSAVLRYVKSGGTSIDLNSKISYNNTIWAGVSYRHKDAVVMMLGLKILDKFQFGYSYDYTISGLQNFSKGSHEVMLGFDVPSFGFNRGRSNF